MRKIIFVVSALVVVLAGCATSAPDPLDRARDSLAMARTNVAACPYHVDQIRKILDQENARPEDIGTTDRELAYLRYAFEPIRARLHGKLALKRMYLAYGVDHEFPVDRGRDDPFSGELERLSLKHSYLLKDDLSEYSISLLNA